MLRRELTDDLLAADARYLWHPYAGMPNALPVFPVDRAEGVRLTLTDGQELVDGMSSWWAAIHGYNHPDLNGAITRQLERMAHVMFGGLTHQPAADLAERLVALTGADLDKVFLCDSGSVSVEVAIKMAVQYWSCLGKGAKNKLLTVRGGYHGDTLAAMSVCDPVTGMHGLFSGVVPEQIFVARPEPSFGAPWNDEHFTEMRECVERRSSEIAAVILEPVVQGAGGMRFYAPEYLRQLRRLCDEQDVLLIFDEIATGFGRSGELFAAVHAEVWPDILCLGKALTGGYMTLAATLATTRVSETISSNEPNAFMHGPTFMANPLACAVALASIDALLLSPWKKRVHAIESQLKDELSPLVGADGVEDVRTLGAIGVVELSQPVDMLVTQPAFVDRGVWLRPFGKLVYTMPPFVIEPADLRQVTSAIVEVVEKHCCG